MPKFSRTVNPLHFEDLEPHRFEDLVRQLAYDFRPWHSIEATGRLGSDEGVDIRAIERIASSHSDTAEEGEVSPSSHEDLSWLIQCKREKEIGPTRLKKIISETVNEETPIPYGFVIAAACDFSYKTREAFRLEANRLGIEESFLWGKAELEDMLFLPKNDHLLFAYFGLSLQVRRRSEKTTLNSRLTTKRRLVSVLGESITSSVHKPVLLRDSAASEYPYPSRSTVIGENDRWRYFNFAGHLYPDYIALIIKEYWAWARFDTKEWDMISAFDQAWPFHPRLSGVDEEFRRRREGEEVARRYWFTKVPKSERAYCRLYGLIHYDRILLIDDIGDAYNEPPHITVDCGDARGFFDRERNIIENDDRWSRESFFEQDGKRIELFPEVIPEVSDEEFNEAIKLRH